MNLAKLSPVHAATLAILMFFSLSVFAATSYSGVRALQCPHLDKLAHDWRVHVRDDIPWHKELDRNQGFRVDGGLKGLLSDVNDVGWLLLHITVSCCKGGKGNSRYCWNKQWNAGACRRFRSMTLQESNTYPQPWDLKPHDFLSRPRGCCIGKYDCTKAQVVWLPNRSVHSIFVFHDGILVLLLSGSFSACFRFSDIFDNMFCTLTVSWICWTLCAVGRGFPWLDHVSAFNCDSTSSPYLWKCAWSWLMSSTFFPPTTRLFSLQKCFSMSFVAFSL